MQACKQLYMHACEISYTRMDACKQLYMQACEKVYTRMDACKFLYVRASKKFTCIHVNNFTCMQAK
jgi:hypothetical protein